MSRPRRTRSRQSIGAPQAKPHLVPIPAGTPVQPDTLAARCRQAMTEAVMARRAGFQVITCAAHPRLRVWSINPSAPLNAA